MKAILKLLNLASVNIRSLDEPEAGEKEAYVKKESENNKPLKDILGHINSYLPPHELAKTDLVCQTVKEVNELHWQKHNEAYFKQQVNEGSTRKAYLNNAKKTTYYVVGEKAFTTKPFYTLSMPTPIPKNSFPKTPTVTVYREKSAAEKAQQEKQNNLANDINYVEESYFGPRYFLFTVKTSNQIPCKSDEGVEVSQAHIKQKTLSLN